MSVIATNCEDENCTYKKNRALTNKIKSQKEELVEQCNKRSEIAKIGSDGAESEIAAQLEQLKKLKELKAALADDGDD